MTLTACNWSLRSMHLRPTGLSSQRSMEWLGYSAFEGPFSEDEEMRLTSRAAQYHRRSRTRQFLGSAIQKAWPRCEPPD